MFKMDFLLYGRTFGIDIECSLIEDQMSDDGAKPISKPKSHQTTSKQVLRP